jgi:hypothetical protein
MLPRIVVSVAMSACLPACAPLPTMYYLPSAEYSKLEPYSCAGSPPYRINVESVGIWTSAFFDGRRIEISFHPSGTAKALEVDTAHIQIDADGHLVALLGQRYYRSDSRRLEVPSPDGRLITDGSSIDLSAESPISNPERLVLHIPPIVVDGISVAAQTITFQRERKVRLRYLVLNC